MTIKPYLQTFLADVKKTREKKEDFLFEVYFDGDTKPHSLTLDSLEPDYAVFRAFEPDSVRGGWTPAPLVVDYEHINHFVYMGKQR